MIKKTILQIKEKSYDVTFPNVGQLQDIEAFKIAFTNGRYVEMAFSGLKTQTFALDLADSIAYLSVLIPTLKDDLKVKHWRDLDPFIAKELVSVYKNDFLKWFKPIADDLYNFDKEESDGTGEKETSTE